jgi:hypothetical protein
VGAVVTVARALLVIVVLLGGACFEDTYRCANDKECDLGEGGRCELDGHCTLFDASCTTNHRYTDHSEELTGTCFDDRQVLANLCAGGQPPALDDDACTRAVCTDLPACCAVGWTDACAQAAQIDTACSLACTTSIAITATKGTRTELWELTWNGTSWDAVLHTDLQQLIAWVAPAPGASAPRLAGLADGGATLVVGNARSALDVTRAYQTITTIDVDRDGRDTAVLTYQTGVAPQVRDFAQVIKLDTSASRDVETPASALLAWGDSNHDGFPDGVVGAGQKYTLLDNIDGAGAAHVRSLAGLTSSNVNGMATPTMPPLRAFDWLDFDGDHQLDLLAAGNSLRLHAGATGINDTPLFNLDCDPPVGGAQCPDQAEFSLTAVAFPSSSGPAIAEAPFRDTTKGNQVRAVYRLTPNPLRPTALMFSDTCTTNCIPIIALVARDLDGDHEMDLVAIDANLKIYTALGGQKLGLPQALPTMLTAVAQLRVSVTGDETR